MRKLRCENCPVRVHGFCELPDNALEEFERASSSALYRAHQIVFVEGTSANGIHLVCQGHVKLYQSDRFGRQHIVDVAGPGAILGELSLREPARSAVSAETLTEAQLCFLPREPLIAFLAKHSDSALHLIAALSAQLTAARRKIRNLALKGGESRLAALLLDLLSSEHGTDRLKLRYSRQELADILGVSAETATRLLGKLRKRGAIEVDGRHLHIVDLQTLTRVARHDEVEM
jgi:CRP/FNR family transcriptional regulator